MLTNVGNRGFENRGFEPPNQWKPIALLCVGFALILLVATFQTAGAVEVDGFTEPNRTIHVAAAETGIVTRILFREGDHVEADQTVAQLDDDVHRALLAVAKQSMDARGRLDSALAELQLREERLHKFEQLRASGHARQEEVDRARSEMAVAEGQWTAVQEDLLIRSLEHDKIKTQLDRRLIRAPIAGVVTQLHKQLGEFVAPNTPEILTLVELDPLLAVFSIVRPHADQLRLDQRVTIRLTETNREVEGAVEFIAPTTDAESGTVRVKVRIDNPDGRYRSGERCVIKLRNVPKEPI